jgi:aminoglycoside 3-N-acetyltransferase
VRLPDSPDSAGRAKWCLVSNRGATIDRFGSLLAALDIHSGDTLLVHSDLRDLVRLADSRELAAQADVRQFLLRAFDTALVEAAGDEGTICVLGTYSDYARSGKPFDLKESPPDPQYGAYNRYLFDQGSACRSLNPLVGFLAKGAKAGWICEHVSACGFGPNTPWDRLTSLDGTMLFWGVDLRNMTFVHHVEQQVGVPHLYHKSYNTPVVIEGKSIDLPVITSVRYLDFNIVYNFRRLTEDLAAAGLLKSFREPPFQAHAVKCRAVQSHLERALAKDPYYLLAARPQFVPGQIPTDGPTGPRRGEAYSA